VHQLKSTLSEGVTVGISGDASAVTGLNAGCEVWYTVCGGLFPHAAKEITDAAARAEHERVIQLSNRLQSLWSLFRKHSGSIRVMAAADRLMLTDSSWPLAGIIIVFAVFISIAMTGQTLDSFRPSESNERDRSD